MTGAVEDRAVRGEPGEVTELLVAWQGGDGEALARLMPVLYGELRRLAAGYLRRERDGHTLETAALVHEAFLRLVDQERVEWRGRRHFFAIAAKMMRRVLVDHARRQRYAKRGGGAVHCSLDEGLTFAPERAPEVIAVDAALSRLAEVDPQRAKIVELRFFAGLNSEEIGGVLGVSPSTVSRGWRTARAYLYRELTAGGGDGA